ncbi:MAG: BspA family leucine-rich repeat surface protein, partial [Prevotella sp.]|nr:BspA family leucine-rich repeat surface protein [Prevotella sp.]
MNNKLLSIIAVFIGIILPMKMQAQGTVGDAISAPMFNFQGDDLVMTCDTEGAEIYYVMSEFADEDEAYSLSENLDVSEANSMRTLYTQPIPITKNVVIKAVAKMPQIQGDSEVTTLIYSYTAWSQLLKAMEYGFSVQARAQDNPEVSDDLKEQLNWALEEGQMIYEHRGEMPDSYEAEHFAQEILEIAHEIEEIIGPAQTGPEPYAVLSNNNTVLTFYYNESKGAFQGSMYVGPFGSNGRRGWDDLSKDITTVVFDESFANCNTLTSTAYWFYGCERLTTITGIHNLKTDNVTSMEAMFYGCLELPSLDLSGFNTSKVTNIDWMFLECTKLTTIYVSDGWSTANIPEGGNVFSGCYTLIGGAGTTYSEDKFDSSFAHIDGGTNNPGYFTDINAPVISEVMLTGKIDNYWYDETGNDPNGYEAIILTIPETPENGNIWEISVLSAFVRNQLAFTTLDGEAVDNITGEFRFESKDNMVALNDGRMLMYESENEQGEIAMIESGMGMIRIINSEITQRLLNNPNSKFMALPVNVTAYLNGREVPVMNGSFTVLVQLEKPQEPEPYVVLSQNNTVLTLYYDTNKSNRGGFDINNYYIENDSNSPYSTITTAVFDASFAEYKPTSTAYWFQKCSSLTSIIGLENLKTDNVWNMHDMFSHCSSLTSLDLSGFKTDNLTDMTQMFDGCSGLKSLNVSGFKTDKVTTMWAVFRGCSSLTSLDVSGFKTDNVTLMTQMFYNCSSLTSLDVSGFKTDKVTRMEDLFYGCSGVTKLDVSGFKTNNATSIYGMFERCSSLTSLDVSGFRTDKVTRIHNLFYGCSSLKTIYGSDWSTVSLEDGEGNNMFTGCNALVGGAGTHYNSSHTNYTYAHIDGGTANPGYFTDKNAPTSREVFVLPGENGMITGSVVTPDGKIERFEIVGGKEAVFNVPNGSNVNLTFRPNAGYRLAEVILNGNSIRSQMPTDSTYVIQNILANMELIATFTALPVEPYAVLSNN